MAERKIARKVAFTLLFSFPFDVIYAKSALYLVKETTQRGFPYAFRQTVTVLMGSWFFACLIQGSHTLEKSLNFRGSP